MERKTQRMSTRIASLLVRPAQVSDCEALARMRHTLWPEAPVHEHARELADILAGKPPGLLPYVVLVAQLSDTLVGFAEVGLRSQAEGCSPVRPVGYLEGWYVAEAYRRRGIGADLLRAASEWARGEGCTEMASDTTIDNQISQRAHEALGFEAVARSVNYRKPL